MLAHRECLKVALIAFCKRGSLSDLRLFGKQLETGE